jgi:DNA helicase-2/ATP-dependent DNA helicase PcrA
VSRSPDLAVDLLASLDPEQRQVAEALRGPVRVLAGAGTGKTRAITHRIAHGVAEGIYAPTEVLAVTFTTRAAGEMRGRLARLGASGVQARTFHSAALRQLRWFWPTTYGGDLPTLTESKIPLVAAASRAQRVQTDQALLRDLASEIEWAKVSNVGPDDYARVAPGRGREVAGLDAETVGRLFGGYEEVKRSQARMDMEDILLLTAGMLAEEERVAAQVRAQYKWFVVDEFQDVSPLQSALLDLWLGGRDEVCVVGDPAQTIYSFAGADAAYLRDFPRKFAQTTSLELDRNYRSTPQVVEAANSVLAGSASTSVRLRAQRPAGPAVRFVPAPDEVAEAEGVADAVGGLLRDGVPASEIAVLFRINAQSEAFEEALASRGLPYVVRGAARFFERAEVKQAVALVRAAVRTDESSSSVTDLVGAALVGMGWSAQAPVARGQSRDRWESLQALMTMAQEAAEATPEEFLADLDRRAAEQHAPAAGGVTLATLHAAKGLEWDAVFLVGMHDGAMPLNHATTDAEVEEERRLLYVGMTRARVHLTVSWAAARAPGGRGNRQPSRFLDGLLPASARAAAAKPRGRKAAHCRECGRPLSTAVEKKRARCEDCPASYDEELFERLRAWRKSRADEESVPAFVVFTDATLQLIAEHRPTTPAALLRISGIGPTKVERYGDGVLALLDESLAGA